MTDTALILRTCAPDLTSHGGFQWPDSGPVQAPDWDPTPDCGHGLHGLLWGEGDGGLLNWDPDARWLIVEVPADTIVDIADKVKFPTGTVIHCGDRLSATTFLATDPRATGRAVVGGTATAGDGGTATAGDEGTATAGDEGTATAGDEGTVVIRRWDRAAQRWRLVIGYIGEDGLKANVAYRLNDTGDLVEAAA